VAEKRIGALVRGNECSSRPRSPAPGGQKGGEFYTPASIVKLLTEVIEPFHGRILDPACGSGGMFVQSARFVAEHQKNPADELAICGVEKTDETGRLCRLNLAVHGLEGDIRHGGNVNSYYDDPHAATGDPEVLLEGGVVGVFFGGCDPVQD
jgi:type I restriction enzyme M protein